MMLAKERRALQIAALDARRRAEAYQQGIDASEDVGVDPNWLAFAKGAKAAMNMFADAIDALLADPAQWTEAVRDFNDSVTVVSEGVDPGARLWQ